MPDFLSAKELAKPERVRIPIAGTHIVGHLYLPQDYSANQRYPALAIAGSLTSVKEQMGGIYAAEMAQRGIIGLAIDYRNYGESGGTIRQYEDPAAKVEDLAAAVAYLSSRPDCRPDGVGLLGVCTSGGTVVQAAARDKNVKAVATVAGHFAEPSGAPAFYAAMFSTGPEIVDRLREQGKAARELYDRTGENTLILAYSNTNRSASHLGPMEYYIDHARGAGVPQWQNAFAVMSWGPWLDFDPVSDASRVSAPTLVVHSDGCVMPDNARKVYDNLNGEKSLHWASGNHFEFYDGPDKVHEAADVAAEHFRKYLG
jgi:fermentation-respiration switch protein FrsA (DUF1100 family)